MELLQFLTLNLCGFDPGLEAGSRLAIKSNLVIYLVPYLCPTLKVYTIFTILLYKFDEVLHLQAIVLAWISIGSKNAIKMFFDYPGVYLTPLFTPFIFGPVEPKEPSRWYNSFGNMNMHLSLWFTYVNTLLNGIGISIALSYILSLSADFFAQYGNQAVITEFFDKFGFANPSFSFQFFLGQF